MKIYLKQQGQDYEVIRIVQSVGYKPGQILTKDCVSDLCRMIGIWEVHIQGAEQMVQTAQMAQARTSKPSTLLRPKLYKFKQPSFHDYIVDKIWRAEYGEVCGRGNSPQELSTISTSR